MPRVEETIPPHLTREAEAARAWFSTHQGSEFKLTGIVDPDDPEARLGQGEKRALALILCGQENGQDVCLRERFTVVAEGDGFEVEHIDDTGPQAGSPAPLLDPPRGTRSQWLEEIVPRHAFTVILFYRGFW